MKKVLLITAVVCMVLAICTVASAKSMEFVIDNATMYTNEDGMLTAVTLETAPFETDGRTMVPVRVIGESFGADVTWDEATSTVGVKAGETEISLAVNSDKAYVNGEEYTLDVPATEINGRTMVPVRFISEALKYDVTYTDELRTVYITDEEAVLTVGDISYNSDDVNTFLAAFAYGGTADIAVENLSQFAVFSNEAKNLSVDTSMQYQAWMEELKAGKDNMRGMIFLTPYAKILKLYSDAVIYTTSLYGEVTDEKIEKAYHSDYISVKHILLLTQDAQTGEPVSDKEKKQIRKKMTDILNQAKSGVDFDKLMNKHSEDTGLAANPDGYVFTKGMMVPEFEEAAYALKTGEISQIIETAYGYHIIKKQVLPELNDEIKASISNVVFNNAITEKYNELKENYEINVNILTE